LNLAQAVTNGYKGGVGDVREKRVRVLVANGPRLMRELVLAVLADQSDIEVIGEIQNESELAIAVEESRPDVLIVALDDGDQRATQCGFLVGRYPQMKILALAPEKNRGVFYWGVVDVHTKPLESSESGILSALREPPSLVSTLYH
jgi:AmiR/NasT family two-component response regulator